MSSAACIAIQLPMWKPSLWRSSFWNEIGIKPYLNTLRKILRAVQPTVSLDRLFDTAQGRPCWIANVWGNPLRVLTDFLDESQAHLMPASNVGKSEQIGWYQYGAYSNHTISRVYLRRGHNLTVCARWLCDACLPSLLVVLAGIDLTW